MSYIVPSPLIYQELVSSGGVLNSTPDLETCIIGPAYNVVKYVAGSVTAQNKTFSSAYSTGTSLPAALPSTKPGQILEESSVKVWFNRAVVEKLSSGGLVNVLGNTIKFTAASMTTGNRITVGSTSVSIPAGVPSGFYQGDSITIPGAGAGGSALHVTITEVHTNYIVISSATLTEISDAVIVKALPDYLNSLTNTPNIAVGDSVSFSLNSTPITSQVASFVVDEDTSTVTSLTMTDVIAPGYGYFGVGNMTSGSSVINVLSSTGLTSGDTVVVYGAGPGGSNLYTTVSSISSNAVTLAATSSVAVTNATIAETLSTSISVQATYYDQLISSTAADSSGNNYDLTGVSTTGNVTISPAVIIPQGKVISTNVHIAYRALRQDLLDQILTFNDITDLTSQLDDLTDQNPLGLAVELALANTVTRIRGITVRSNDLAGYLEALELSEAERLYALVPLTRDLSILSAFKAHVLQMSTPENASWRVALVSFPIDTTKFIGSATSALPNSTSGNSIATVGSITNVLTSSSASFISDHVTAGDTVVIVSATGDVVGTVPVAQVLSNQQIKLGFTSTKTASNVVFYIQRNYSKTEQANNLKLQAQTYACSRVVNVFPDTIGVSIDGVTKYVPGYYLASAVGGMVAGFPVQQGFTNIGIAGITDLRKSNFYFSKANLNTIAEGGNFIYIQDTQGGTPYCRHELTTDVSNITYSELLRVKNWDFLSYFYYDKVRGYIGRYNITSDTKNLVRQTLVASSELLKSKKLPKIGAPLLSYNIDKLEQDSVNKDTLAVTMTIEIVYPLNYLTLVLSI